MIGLKQFFIWIFLVTFWIQGEQQSLSLEPHKDQTAAVINSTDLPTQTDLTVPEEEIEEELFDIRPEVALPHHTLFYCLLLFFSFLAFLLIGSFIWKWRKKQGSPTVVPLSPYTKALQGLDAALEQIHQKDQKPFAFGLTDSVRHYLADVFNLPAPESTTEEVLEKLKEISDLNEDLKHSVNQLLKACDLAKFTQQEFNYEMRLKLYHQAKEIIQEADRCLQQKLAIEHSIKDSHANV